MIQVVVGQGTKYEKHFDYTIRIMKKAVPYDAEEVGFDFSVLSDEDIAHDEGGAFYE